MTTSTTSAHLTAMRHRSLTNVGVVEAHSLVSAADTERRAPLPTPHRPWLNAIDDRIHGGVEGWRILRAALPASISQARHANLSLAYEAQSLAGMPAGEERDAAASQLAARRARLSDTLDFAAGGYHQLLVQHGLSSEAATSVVSHFGFGDVDVVQAGQLAAGRTWQGQVPPGVSEARDRVGRLIGLPTLAEQGIIDTLDSLARQLAPVDRILTR